MSINNSTARILRANSQSYKGPSKSSFYKKHAALRGNPRRRLQPEEWYNVNRRIAATADIIISRNYVLDGLGPGKWDIDGGLGIALLACVQIRPLKAACSLSDEKIQSDILNMARDPSHPHFRHNSEIGNVWFQFRMLNLDLAVLPLEDSTAEASMSGENTDLRKQFARTRVEIRMGDEKDEDIGSPDESLAEKFGPETIV
ncbi:hypothetical protein F5Y15DRAFT_416210 [Xylariaceae sp. FL0016]|nr:hypothetical protein F5Y15DRAFT_416210 [Xylariaceae sp. FL0016]